METCLLDVKSWMLANKLKMNDGKTEFIIIGSRQQLNKIKFDSIKVGDSIVKCVESVRDLGAYIDNTLSMEEHIDAKCKAAFRQVYSIRRIRKFLTREATETLIHAFIFSHLLWMGNVQCLMQERLDLCGVLLETRYLQKHIFVFHEIKERRILLVAFLHLQVHFLT